MAVLGSPFLIVLMVSVDVKQTMNLNIYIYVCVSSGLVPLQSAAYDQYPSPDEPFQSSGAV